FNLQPREAVIVGDSEKHDVWGGTITGMKTVLVSKRPASDSLADYRFASLAEASGTLASLKVAGEEHSRDPEQQGERKARKHLVLPHRFEPEKGSGQEPDRGAEERENPSEIYEGCCRDERIEDHVSHAYC